MPSLTRRRGPALAALILGGGGEKPPSVRTIGKQQRALSVRPVTAELAAGLALPAEHQQAAGRAAALEPVQVDDDGDAAAAEVHLLLARV
jgi:hypothetical protein